MKERPILFNGEMVRAILEGRKTQTRRPLNSDALEWVASYAMNPRTPGHPLLARCPFGQPGDRLWARETWAVVPSCAFGYDAEKKPNCWQVLHPNDSTEAAVFRSGWDRVASWPWRPSIHMPRWASRITLEITGVRVERLQEIREEDAQAEGTAIWAREALTWGERWENQRMNFAMLWEAVYGKESWSENPWVWVVEFKRVTP